jgi:hypothetical protein
MPPGVSKVLSFEHADEQPLAASGDHASDKTLVS